MARNAPNKDKMKPIASGRPGLETDGKGKIIPVAKRAATDRQKVHAAATRRKKK
jgi:hypothetical protein